MSDGRPSRRTFLQGAGAVVGASALGAKLPFPAASEPSAAAPGVGASGLTGIEHVVVLMLENRSFDNVLGWLYDPANAAPFDVVPGGQTFDGLSGKVLSNPVPPDLGGGTASPGTETVTWYPDPDPGEVFADVYEQLFDTDSVGDPNRADVPGMQGFVNNYARTIAEHNALHPPGTDPRIIMNGFRPPSISNMAGLANAFGVCDQWYSSIPTQTFCNRSFVHAGTSSGYVNNLWKTGSAPWDVGVFLNETPTIFNLLEAAQLRWRIYHAGSLAFCMSFLTQHALTPYATPVDSATNRFFPLTQFFADVATPGPGGLPNYSFIEPNYLTSKKYGPENDGHPNPPYNLFAAPSNLLWADKLVGEVYAALRASPNWESTLLMITFDEHGGCYDHVPPGPTVSPDGVVVPANEPGGSGFAFARLGLRVPTILVSPRIDAGLVAHTQFEHTSIIKTVINALDVRGPNDQPATLLAREAAASDVGVVLTLDTPRTDDVVLPSTPEPFFDPTVERPLTPLQSDIVAAGAALLERFGVPLPFRWTELETTQEATDELDGRFEALRSRGQAVPAEPTFTG
jgi:phospholipase C